MNQLIENKQIYLLTKSQHNPLYYSAVDELFIMSIVHAVILKSLQHTGGKLMSEVFHTPSHEPHFLRLTSVHNYTTYKKEYSFRDSYRSYMILCELRHFSV